MIKPNLWAHAILTTPGSDLTLLKNALDEQHDLLMQEITCWRMYGYLVEFFMDEMILTQVE